MNSFLGTVQFLQFLTVTATAEFYTELEELSGMMIIPCPVCGDSTHPVEFHMVLIGITGEQSRRLLGKKITGSG